VQNVAQVLHTEPEDHWLGAVGAVMDRQFKFFSSFEAPKKKKKTQPEPFACTLTNNSFPTVLKLLCYDICIYQFLHHCGFSAFWLCSFRIQKKRYVKHLDVCNTMPSTWPSCATTNKHTTSGQTKLTYIPLINSEAPFYSMIIYKMGYTTSVL
jgi:hypothetical protein